MENTDLNWRKASYSSNGGASCVEIANTDVVLVRDTTDRSGPVLAFTPDTWRKFTTAVRRSLAFDASQHL